MWDTKWAAQRAACRIKPEKDDSRPQEDDSGRKTTRLRSGKLRRGRQVIKYILAFQPVYLLIS